MLYLWAIRTGRRRGRFLRSRGVGRVGGTARSEATFFVAPAAAQALAGLLRSPAGGRKVLVSLPQGRIGLRFAEGPYKGKLVKGSVVPAARVPQVGLAPVEGFGSGNVVRVGAPVVRLEGKPVAQSSVGRSSNAPVHVSSSTPAMSGAIDDVSGSLPRAQARVDLPGGTSSALTQGRAATPYGSPPLERPYNASGDVDLAPPGKKQKPWDHGPIDLGPLEDCCFVQDPDSFVVKRHLADPSTLPESIKSFLRENGVEIYIGDCPARDLDQSISDGMSHQLASAGGYSYKLRRIYLGNGESSVQSVPIHEVGHAIGYLTGAHDENSIFGQAHLDVVDELPNQYGWRLGMEETPVGGQDIDLLRLARGRRESFAEIFDAIRVLGKKGATKVPWPESLVEIVLPYATGDSLK